MTMVRPGARVLLLDIDLSINDLALVNVLRNVHPGVVYFPVVWSLYSPESISYVEHATLSPVQAFSEDQGTWRKYGFGIVAIHADDVRKVQWDEAFEGWGGEDNAFHRSVETTPGLRIVRQNDEGLIHAFHEKHCSGVTKRQKRACEGAKEAYTHSPKARAFLQRVANTTLPIVMEADSLHEKIYSPLVKYSFAFPCAWATFRTGLQASCRLGTGHPIVLQSAYIFSSATLLTGVWPLP